jgi:hypothetical protein
MGSLNFGLVVESHLSASAATSKKQNRRNHEKVAVVSFHFCLLPPYSGERNGTGNAKTEASERAVQATCSWEVNYAAGTG